MNTMSMTKWRAGWREIWTGKAARIRRYEAERIARWEAATEPGYPLPSFERAGRDIGLALADLYDAIGGKR